MPTDGQGRQAQGQVVYDTHAQLSSGRNRETLVGLTGPMADLKGADAHELPVVVREGVCARFMDRYYDARREGLYRFWNWGSVEYAHPEDPPGVCKPSGSYLPADHSYAGFIRFDSDLLKLLGGLAVLHLHGHRHAGLSEEQRRERLHKGALCLICGDISFLCVRILGELGVRARVVYVARLEGRWNTYNNGHVLFEFFWPEKGKWVLADVDLHCVFKRGDTYLNLAELHPMVVAGEPYTLELLTPAGEQLLDSGDSGMSDFPGMRMFEEHLIELDARKAWYDRIFTAVGHWGEEGQVFASCHANAGRLARYQHEGPVIGWQVMVERFYGRGV